MRLVPRYHYTMQVCGTLTCTEFRQHTVLDQEFSRFSFFADTSSVLYRGVMSKLDRYASHFGGKQKFARLEAKCFAESKIGLL
jgi:hypothetical protein